MNDADFMRLALRLARKGYGETSPNPMVGAVLVKSGKIIGRGWHRRAGLPHAEIEALHDAKKRGHNPRGATLYVTLEPCCTHGRTPPCTEAIIAAGIKRTVIGATDPNPKHAGKGFQILKREGIKVVGSSRCDDRTAQRAVPTKLADECARLNEVFNHWIVHRTPFVTVKTAMTLDGKIATASGESKWITGEKARAYGMKLRQGNDAILVGVNTIIADNPSLTARTKMEKPIRRIILDPMARTPLNSKIVSDEFSKSTTIVVSKNAPAQGVSKLATRTNILVAPIKKSAIGNLPRRCVSTAGRQSAIDLLWLLRKLGSENVISLLVEGGGETNASFLLGRLANQVAFFYAPKILGGRDSRKAVAGDGVKNLADAIQLRKVEWKKIGEDLLMTAQIV